MFFKTRSPVEPVSFVHAICSDAATATSRKRSRFVKRLTPMTLMGRASEKGLDEVAQLVLAPAFHQPGEPAKKVSYACYFSSCSDSSAPSEAEAQAVLRSFLFFSFGVCLCRGASSADKGGGVV